MGSRPGAHVSLSGVGGLGDAAMLSAALENLHRAGYRCVVHRSRHSISELFEHDPRCTTVARGPLAGEMEFRFNYWPVSSRHDFDGHMIEAAFVYNGVGELLTYPECRLFVTEAELALARWRVGPDRFMIYQTETSDPYNPKSPADAEWRRLLGSLADLPLVHVGAVPCTVIRPTVELGGELTLREWMAVTLAADLAITPDTALGHMASAMGCPAAVVGTGLQYKFQEEETITHPLSHFMYPSATPVLPVRGQGKQARYDVEAFGELVQQRFDQAVGRPRDRSPYVTQPKPPAADVPYSVARRRRRQQEAMIA